VGSHSPALHALGAALRSARTQAGLTQRALAARSGVSVRQLGAIERAQTDPTYETLLKLADALGVSLSELLAQRRYCRNVPNSANCALFHTSTLLNSL
jgi:transcriptional regulator with XRE-family HTH domain